MGIPESQLDTWAHQGSIKQSSDTYATVKRALESSGTGYATKSYEVFLQGSYGNDTNIYAESDVDVVIRLDSTFHYDIKSLSPADVAVFEGAYPGSAEYKYDTFKSDVLAVLVRCFGADVKAGNKAIKIKAGGNRRNADVVVATEFRRYSSFSDPNTARLVRGIRLQTAEGSTVINYPKQHSANCTTKHQGTASWFKPMVRIFKNMRSALVEDRIIRDGSAPSYFLEGLLYNVPTDKFGESYGSTFVAAMNWLVQADRTKLLCANEQYYLVRDGAAECWATGDCNAFIEGAIGLWNKWS
jgi:hypothetical protein